MNNKIIYIFILFLSSLVYSNANFENSWCGTNSVHNRDFERFEYTFPQFIDSTHYRVHFTTEPADSFYWNDTWMTHQSTIAYATTVLEQAEFTYSAYENNGWQMPPVDCDESITDSNNPYHCINYGGNSLYDIYIGLVQGPAALVYPENSNIQLPYTGSSTSYILFANGLGIYGSYDDLASFNYYIVAHEIHHSIQFAYGPNFTGTSQNPIHQGWIFEQTATFMENFIYPNSFHLRLLLSNCNIVNPLTHPEIGIYQSYSGALWQVFIQSFLNDDNLIRHSWESYGTRITNGEEQVTFFDIFNDEILLTSYGNYNLEDMYKEYSIWRYFTGDRAIPNQYFNEAHLYCTSSTIQLPENNINLQSELGGNYYIEIPNNDILINLQSENTISVPAMLMTIDNIFSDLDLSMGNNIINVNDDEHILFLTSGYTQNDLNFENIHISIDIDESIIGGDINEDGIINIIDLVLLVNLILENQYESLFDLNDDGLLNIIDVVILVNIILY